MDVKFNFSNLIGSVYRNGQIAFSPDGYSVYSPVGNKISIFDLKNNVSRTLSFESLFNIVTISVSSKGTHFVVANEAGDVLYVNLHSENLLHKFRANRTIRALQFSPDDQMLAICRDFDLQIHKLNQMKCSVYRPLQLYMTYNLSTETLNCLDWSFDGCLIVAGGDDKVVRVVGSKRYRNVHILQFGLHKGPIVNCQFFKESYDLISVCRRGVAYVWKSSVLPGDLVEGHWTNQEQTATEDGEQITRLFYNKTKRFSLLESSGSGKQVDVTAAKFHSESNLLVTAFSNGSFVLHEIPTFALIHNLRVSDYAVSTVAINRTGDWLGIGCGQGSNAQLIVWEWQSETYALKQQSHSQRISTISYSPDGSLLATGAEDGKVKIWNNRTSFCIVTFDEHTSAVSCVKWTQSGKAILSASLDGTVRAHDMKRYRNFRTLVCPEPTQLGSLVVDKSGDLVVAAGKEVYNIFVWSLENGRLLDVLSGHELNISSIDLFGNTLVTASWDRTIRVWNVLDSTSEITELHHEALFVRFSPSGDVVAVLTSDSVITLYHTKEMALIGTIETAADLDPSRSENEQIKRDTSGKSKSFTSLDFSPNGHMLLVGGESNFFCLYSVSDRQIITKFKITENRSLDGVVMDVNKRNFTEFGNMLLFDTSDEEYDGSNKKAIKLPGSKHTDLGERRGKIAVEVQDVAFCPTGRRFAICSTEGVAVYSLDRISIFDPFQLETTTDPKFVKRSLMNREYSQALMGSLQLNNSDLIQSVIERTDAQEIILVVRSLPIQYAERLLRWMANDRTMWNTQYPHLYMFWLKALLEENGMRMKSHVDVATLTGLQQIVSYREQQINKLADQNKFSLKYLLNSRRIRNEMKKEDDEPMEE
ncbi:hypothetical protein WR25_06225 [Diploscapter pachys]|uniref:Uncharacterized protein n=1 Tax=Diploscapter pachys TaxID=2018661 RepID=A0A2A2M0A7_9BILA|nr:hypothetical protein WR25_06225 [Diploscapter pachys]